MHDQARHDHRRGLLRSDEQKAEVGKSGGVPIGIGEGCTISNAIIDKNARIGKNCTITNAAGVEDPSPRERRVHPLRDRHHPPQRHHPGRHHHLKIHRATRGDERRETARRNEFFDGWVF